MGFRKICPLKLFSYSALAIIVAVYTYFTVTTYAFVNAYIGDEVWYPTAAYNILKIIFHITPPMYFPYSNEAGIQNYVNTCHPPLAKYFMASTILILGYQPAAWRIWSWVLGDLMLIVAFFLGKYLLGDHGYRAYLGGIVSTLLVALDPNIWLLHGVAMLEIYVSFFGILSLYFLLKKKLLWGAIALGLAMASKEPAYLLILPFLYYLGDLKKSPIDRTIYGLGIPIVTFGAVSLPIIDYYGGFLSWLKGTFLDRASWDITNGHISLADVSQISTPWGWFMNIHPFWMGFHFYATTNPFIMLLWPILTIIVILLKEKNLIFTSMWAWTEWLGFLMVYFLGNHTLFSFYVTDFSPVVDVFVAVSMIYLVDKLVLRQERKSSLQGSSNIENGDNDGNNKSF